MNTLAKCLKLSGAPAAGVLLFRLNHWSRFASILRGGEKWVVKYAAEWAEDTGLSVTQYQYALNKLVGAGLVNAEKHMWNGHALTFLQLSNTAVWQLNAEWEDGKIVPTGDGKNAVTHITKELHKGSTPSEIEQTPYSPQKAGSGEKQMPTVEEIMQMGVKKKPGSKTGKMPIQNFWMQELAEVFPGKFHKALTAKQIGQLKLFAKACAENDPYVVLTQVLKDWTHFAGTVKAEAGLKAAPSEPNIDFLLKHAGVAVNFAKAPTPVETYTPKKKPVQLIAPKSEPTPPKEQKASLDDINSILFGNEDEDGN